MTDTRPIILIVGPTAGGKTRLSLDLANALPGGGEIIGCDSMQVYRGMDIGTAKPTPAERAQSPHHLIDIADPVEKSQNVETSKRRNPEAGGQRSEVGEGAFGFTVDRWLVLAEQTIADIRSRGKWPIVVGGTNLYVQALLSGFESGPPPDEGLRVELSSLDEAQLRGRLEEVDPVSAARIHPNDRKRTIRAIEVHAATGRSISDSQTHWEQQRTRDDVIIIGLDYAAEAINPRINARVRQMMADGLLEEVRHLHAPPLGPLGMQAREALGYKQIIDHLEGRMSLEDAVEQIKIRTRRYAKQQRTWLRRFRMHQPSLWLDAANMNPQELASDALAFILRSTNAAYAE